MTSTIPRALDALVELFTAAAPDAQVEDGQPAAWAGAKLIVVGWTIEQVSVAMTASRESAGTDDRERYDIACYLTVFSGDRPMKLVRDDAFALYDQLAAVLRGNQRLATDTHPRGVVMRARPRVVHFDQYRVDGSEDFASGIAGTIEWNIGCDGFAR